MESSNELFALAEELANIVSWDAEARLRADLAAAAFSLSAYRAIRDASEESAAARKFLAQARDRCARTEHLLRQRVSRLIAEISMRLNDDELSSVVGHVVSLNA
jgi:hypothetical protein